MKDFIISVGIDFLAIYSLLVFVYFVAGLIIERMNRNSPGSQKIRRAERRSKPVKADILQSLKSLALVSILYSFGDSLQKTGYGWSTADLTAGNVAWQIPCSALLYDAWYYWCHRALHVKWLYKRIHRLHHASNPPTVWSNNSETMLDTLILQSYWAVVPMLFPILPLVKLLHKIHDEITGMLSHGGYENSSRIVLFPSPLVGVLHHDQHHQYFNCNYASYFSLWDRLMGTLHANYDTHLRRLVTSVNGSNIERE